MKDHTAEISADLLSEIRDRFAHVSSCPFEGERVFFENAGGALTLKSVVETSAKSAAIPDNQGRDNPASYALVDVIRNCFFLLVVNAIYYWRARTEEAHLLAEDPKYRDYHAWMEQNGVITAPLAKAKNWLLSRAVSKEDRPEPQGEAEPAE